MPVIAMLFPGAGSAEPNMGRDLYSKVPAARDAMDRADKALVAEGVRVTKVCLLGTPADLRKPSLGGVAMLALAYGACMALKARKVSPQWFVGAGSGFLAACAASGALPYEQALLLALRRGRLMERVWEMSPFFVCATQGVPLEQADLACQQQGLRRVATLGQESWVLAGPEAALRLATEAWKGPRGVKISEPVPGWDWPSSALDEHRAELESLEQGLDWERPSHPLWSVGQGLAIRERMAVAPALLAESGRDVDWAATFVGLRAAGVDTAIELGHGQALGSAWHKTDPGVRVLAAFDAPSFGTAAKLAQ